MYQSRMGALLCLCLAVASAAEPLHERGSCSDETSLLQIGSLVTVGTQRTEDVSRGTLSMNRLQHQDVLSLVGARSNYNAIEAYSLSIFTGTSRNSSHGLTKAEMDARLEIMNVALQKAISLAKSPPNVLKVFVAPEFFWTGHGTSVPADQAESIVDHLLKISKDQSDWLFVFGTIVVVEGQGPNYEVMNFAPVIADGQRWAMSKKYISNVDLKSQVTPGTPQLRNEYDALFDTDIGIYLKDNQFHILEPDDKPTFPLGGHIIGIDVCLDHSCGRLKDSTAVNEVSVHLITSCGMQWQPGKEAKGCKALLIQDGQGDHSRNPFKETLITNPSDPTQRNHVHIQAKKFNVKLPKPIQKAYYQDHPIESYDVLQYQQVNI
jgi:hypothetical protein